MPLIKREKKKAGVRSGISVRRGLYSTSAVGTPMVPRLPTAARLVLPASSGGARDVSGAQRQGYGRESTEYPHLSCAARV